MVRRDSYGQKWLHWMATGICFPSFAFSWNARFHCKAFIILLLPRLLNEMSLSHMPLFLPSHLVLSLFALPSISLPSCVWQIQLIPTAFQPPQWLHGLATQLGAHYLLMHRAKDRQRQSVPFCCVQLASIILSPSLPRHFLSKKRCKVPSSSLSLHPTIHPLHYNILHDA